MKDKKYLDKVIGHLVKGTKIDYENKEVNTPFRPFPYIIHTSLSTSSFYLLLNPPLSPSPSFFTYCRRFYGLTKDEILYIWKEYRNIINGKIEDGK